MSAYDHADWNTEDQVQERRRRLEAHIAEVSARIHASLSSGGNSRSTEVLVSYRRVLMEERRLLDADPAANPGGGLGLARLARPR